MGALEGLSIEIENAVESVVNNELVEASVKFINEKIAETVFKGSIEIGNYVLNHFFDDDIELASSPDPYKSASYSALCRHPNLVVSRQTLSNMVRVAAQERFLIANSVDVGKIGYSHRVELLKLENNDTKIALACECIERSLSVRKFITLVNETCRGPEEKIESAATKMAKKHIAKYEYLMDDSSVPSFFYNMDEMRTIEKETRQKMRQTFVSMLEKIPNITQGCQYLISSLDQIAIELEENI